MQLEEAAQGVEDDALAYLRHAREEAAAIPLVCASAMDARAFDEARTTSYLPQEEAAAPDPPYAWMCRVVDDFLAARAQVAREPAAPPDGLPGVSDWQGWCACIAKESFQPFSATLARMDHALVCRCLRHLADGMAERGTLHISPHTGLWMYGLLVRLEKPVHMRLAATLREIAQLSRCLRPPDGAAEAVLVPVYDTLLVLAGGFFGQDEVLAPLVDEYVCLNQLA